MIYIFSSISEPILGQMLNDCKLSFNIISSKEEDEGEERIFNITFPTN